MAALSPDDYRAIFESAPDATLVVGADGSILDANPRAQELFGHTRDSLVGNRVELLVPESSKASHRGLREGYMDDPHARPMGVGLELYGMRADGSRFPAEISLSPWRRDGDVRVICTVRDISNRQRLRSFGVSTLQATEDERQRIARELHDDTAQQLAALLVWLRLAAQTQHPEERARQLDEIRQGLQDVIDGVRRIARGLRPPELQDAGVGPAIQAHVRQMTSVTTTAIETDLGPVDADLTPEAQLVVYRVVQEALSNAVRHADADTVAVRLAAEDGRVIAEVTDDGKGFDPEALPDGVTGLGLVGMAERATMVGGTLTVRGAPGAGSTVRLELPSLGDTHDG